MSTLFHLFLQVRNISLGQDGLSPNHGVFVEEVEVTAPRGSPVVFPCRCWLAEDEDDGQTTRVLVPGESLTSRYDSKSLLYLTDVVIYSSLLSKRNFALASTIREFLIIRREGDFLNTQWCARVNQRYFRGKTR